MDTTFPRETRNDSTLDQIIRPRDLSARLGLSLTTLWRMRKSGDLPEPIHISTGAKGWRERDITAWLAAREAGRSSGSDLPKSVA